MTYFHLRQNIFYGIVWLVIILMITPFSSEAAHGTFMIVKGEVIVELASGKKEWAKVGMQVTEGSKVNTGKESQAKIVMSDRNIISIGPNTQLEIKNYKNDASGKKAEFKLNEGQVRAIVNEKYDEKENTFRIATPTAVAGVRGTDFKVTFDPGSRQTQVHTFKGLVAVGLPDPRGNQNLRDVVMVPAGKATTVSYDENKGTTIEPARPLQQNEGKDFDSQEPTNSDDQANKNSSSRENNDSVGSNDGEKEMNTGNNQPKKENQTKSAQEQANSTNENSGRSEPRREGNMIKGKDIAPRETSLPTPSAREPAAVAPPMPVPNIVNPINQNPNVNIINETIRNQITNEPVKVNVEIKK